MSTSTCEKCGSNRIIRDTPIADFSHGNIKKDLSVYIPKTDRILFNKMVKGELLAHICGSCGHVELTIANPSELWEAYTRSKS
jgi:uncharacterized OB-fold protein